jgi:hypothetical protein
MAGQIAAADDGADGRAGDDVWNDAGLVEGPQHTDVRPPSRGSATEGQANLAYA